MKSCWHPVPEDRPTFTNLRHKLEFILQQDTPYLDLDAASVRMIDEEETSSQGSDAMSLGSNVMLQTISEDEGDDDVFIQEDDSYLGKNEIILEMLSNVTS